MAAVSVAMYFVRSIIITRAIVRLHWLVEAALTMICEVKMFVGSLESMAGRSHSLDAYSTRAVVVTVSHASRF